ncbi:MAG TPA: pseudoazurin [Chromatiales bacterium]|nr:pseudoazurin [Chromatiales bacterium]
MGLFVALGSFPVFADGTTHEVKMLNNGKDGPMVFEPGFIKIAKGDTVKFVSVDPGHDSVSTITPEGAAGWKGELSKDVSVTPDKEGVYIYVCTPHTALGMVGVIQVGEAINKTEAEKAAKELSTKIVMGKDRLKKYLAEVK